MYKLSNILLLLILGLVMQTANSQTILVFGDSLSAAYKLDPADGWVNLLQNKAHQLKLDLKFVNASITGETTRGGLSRFKQALDKHHPDIVILELGGNDGLRGFPPKVIKQNLTRMIELAKNQPANLLLAGIYLPPNYGKRYTEMFHNIYVDLAKQYNIALIPSLLEGIGTNKSLMQADGIHPTVNAQPLIAETVWGKLSLLLAKPSSTAINKSTATQLNNSAMAGD